MTEALRELSQDLERAEGMARRNGEGERGEGESGQPGLAETLAETRALRRELQELARGGDNVNRGGDPVRTGRDDRPGSTGEFVDDIEFSREFDRSAVIDGKRRSSKKKSTRVGGPTPHLGSRDTAQMDGHLCSRRLRV